MRLLALHIAAATAFAVGVPVLAQDALAVAPAATAPIAVAAGDMIRSADGKTIGRIDNVQVRDGRPVSVALIFNHRFVRIPVSTLSAGAKGVVTTLSRKDIAQMK